ENAIRLGAPTWNLGNQLGTYALYRDTTRGILADLIKDPSCGPIYDTLHGALERARKEQTPGSAGWDLRHGFDAFMEIVARGESPKLPRPMSVDRAVSPHYDRDCPDLFTWVQRAEKALADGKADEEAKKMLAELKGAGSCPKLNEALAAAIKKKQAAAA